LKLKVKNKFTLYLMKPNYLGQKGYSIYKKNLSIEQQNDLRRELMVQAKVPNSPVKTEPFPIYLESIKNLVVVILKLKMEKILIFLLMDLSEIIKKI
jgi:hypothetical protein